MDSSRWLLGQILGLVRTHRLWMTWNLLLAVIPSVIAVPLFRHPGRRGAGWWMALAVFVLFLPNAPYVLTDLVHLRGDIAAAATDGVVVFGILPIYALFITAGFVSYAFALHEVAGSLRRTGRSSWERPVELALHLLCAIGVVLGRMARLNSWDTVASPVGSADRSLGTLSSRLAPVAVLLLFAAITIGHAAIRTAARELWRRTATLLRWGGPVSGGC